ncbi:MAG TPA: hypothetical protein DGU45_07925 [Planctomycetes bacterium]|nr:hypothetical protein [Planctomycetota bacterium]
MTFCCVFTPSICRQKLFLSSQYPKCTQCREEPSY